MKEPSPAGASQRGVSCSAAAPLPFPAASVAVMLALSSPDALAVVPVIAPVATVFATAGVSMLSLAKSRNGQSLVVKPLCDLSS
eukprot:CAMPEP_0119499026 /NCGR_PEP_ID=MMETSP1344-20130328/21616_1 /TAXON_ID=236787 /ORGANISM="Florenciella parvula, Strain CCMP2471" /LENGTH=83 /DNA_ID=CAMNT_0007534975 /DNA_START=393 /DNA_END=644 /DNA_ORIENTATION=-